MARAETANQVFRNAPMKAWMIHHIRTLIGSLGFLTRNGLSSFMTMAVIAIALALPSGMYVALNNISSISIGWDDSAQISLFLKTDVTERRARSLTNKLKLYQSIEQVKFIHKDDAMKEFQRVSGFGEALEALGENPLPHVITVQPQVDPQRPDKIRHLLKELEQLAEVDLVQLDLQWVKRLYSMIEIGTKVIWLIAGLLGLAVLLVVGNTIRLDIQNRREEIEVTKLIGATNAFIRRPFLYTGFWYGLIGGLLAWLLIGLSIGLLDHSVSRLAMLYDSSFKLNGLPLNEALSLIGFSCMLGLLGSWLAVSRHLHEIEPS
ncbi:MAG: permease-like cell division protein FtsX [Gammaproteobacteria bacterium]|nr:permease-like cell division protein FtsX [Gammaproteobacteria bacterium]